MKDARILFVEDDPIAGLSVRAWLEHKGAHTIYVETTEAADAALAGQEFDVLLSDIHIPGNENLGWVERVARQHPGLQVVLLTGSPRIDNAIKAANLHVAAFLVKPPDFSELETILTTLRDAARARRRGKACVEALRAALAQSDGGDEAALARNLRELQALWPLLEADLSARAPAGDLRDALADAIRVIERTKDSFHSRELGQLRQRLRRALGE